MIKNKNIRGCCNAFMILSSISVSVRLAQRLSRAITVRAKNFRIRIKLNRTTAAVAISPTVIPKKSLVQTVLNSSIINSIPH